MTSLLVYSCSFTAVHLQPLIYSRLFTTKETNVGYKNIS